VFLTNIILIICQERVKRWNTTNEFYLLISYPLSKWLFFGSIPAPPLQKVYSVFRIRSVAEEVEHQLYKCKALELKPQSHQKQRKESFSAPSSSLALLFSLLLRHCHLSTLVVFMPGRERPVDRQSDVHSSIIFILVEIPF
jgi:hypothetical protein